MRIVALLLCSTLGTAALAAVPVVESKGQPRGAPATPRSAADSVANDSSVTARAPLDDVLPGKPVDVPEGVAAPAGADPVSLRAAPAEQQVTGSLVYQVQVLRQELQQLRGMLEEQQHRIAEMEKDQRDRYLDVDRRLAGAPATDEPNPSPGDRGAVSDTLQGVDAGERAAYSAAVQLTRDKQFQQAIDAFNKQLTDYPDGTFSANAFYWLGELYIALPKPKLELARQSFAQVVNLYSDHPKMPDALYKLGVVYGKLGDRATAERYMRRVRDEFPGTPAAGLAETFIASPD